MKLSMQLREDTGYGWVMARLEPVSPFGHALARSPRWYGPGEEGPLEEEFSRVEALRALLDAGEPALDSLPISSPSSATSATLSGGPPMPLWMKWSSSR